MGADVGRGVQRLPPIGAKVAAVRARIAAACDRAGRDPATVTLIAVTKYASVEQVRAVVDAGVVDLGENQYQQLRDRAADPALTAAAPARVRWHAIGPLQTNKARYVARFAHAFHALDRLDVAEALSARLDRPLACSVQVNVAGEATKAGIEPGRLAEFLAAVAEDHPNLDVVGLMTMPPLTADPDDSRRWFRALRDLAGEHGLPGLSMGTTADFDVAVEEGATAVRVGGALFA